MLRGLVWLGFVVLGIAPCAAAPVNVAVASNFLLPLRVIAETYEAQGGGPIEISVGATGHHYAQIVNGAPYDVFLAADQARPARLVQEGHAAGDSLFTYARGGLLLWVAPSVSLPANGLAGLAEQPVRRLAIANPALAPYGLAAQQALIATELWDDYRQKIVQTQNVGQAVQYVATANVSHALVAASYAAQSESIGGHWMAVDPDLYTPIRQDAVRLYAGPNQSGAKNFLAFLKSPAVTAILNQFGYQPGVSSE
ncbi:MAG: molybdate ABC transporter substrate-binding protein [Spiribacter sp.]|jgi:molybdate transport system substrate-binding protein|nr:molybdate ABC transporter substrate-binding protein [Spiribacter sp.]MDR9488715.1 molybdate ABC transporter substrate-binding protein [Spiribacter sp.]